MIIKKFKIYLEYIYILALGAITSFSLPPYNYWIINFLTLSLLITVLFKNKNKNLKEFFFYGYLFGFGYFVSNLYWIPLSLVHDDNFKFLIPFAIILIPAFISLFYGFSFFIFKLFLNTKSIFINVIIFSLILGFFEYLRGTIFSGFPWNLFAHTFSQNIEFIQIISIIGIYSFNTLCIALFSILSIFYFKRKKIDYVGFSLILIITLSIYIYGNLRIKNFNNLESETLPSKIIILSTKISIERFYNNLDNEQILKELINISDPKQDEKSIFIWPEGVIPNINLASLKNEYDYLFQKSFSDNHKIILGINDEEIQNGKPNFYNSLSIIDNNADLKYKYYKNRLVPFGEFLPFENALSKIGIKTLTNNYQSYSSSSDRKIYTLNKSIKILPLICYEIIYSGEISKNNNYDFIVNISEDGWFGGSIGPYQHFAHSIFRSVEYGKYTLRSANNGISAIVDPTGLIVDKLNINDEGIISIIEARNLGGTFFSTYGNKIYFLVILLFIFLIFSFNKLKDE